MTAFLLLLAVLVVVIAAVVYLDAIGFDPWPWLYGETDPRELDRERGNPYMAPWSDRAPGDLTGGES